MALVDLLESTLGHYNNTDPKWVQFVKDHKNYIIKNSNIRYITPEYMQVYQYNLVRYLNSIQYDTQCTWIIELINNITNDVTFSKGVASLIIPPINVIDSLYTTYITVSSRTR